MAKKSKKTKTSDQAFLEKLNRHPDLKERMEKILGLAEDPQYQHLSADELETMLIEEVRKLGAETMRGWANGVEDAIGQEFKATTPGSHCSKKNE